MLGGRRSRLILTALVVAAVFSLLYPHAIGFVSTSAFVNAPIISVRAPFDGVIETPSKQRADSLGAGETLLEFGATRDSRLELAQILSRLAALDGRLSAIDAQISHLSEISESLHSRRQTEQGVEANLAGARFAQALASRSAAESNLRLLAVRMDRIEALSVHDIVARSAVEDLEFEIERARAELDRANAVLDALRIESDAIEDLDLTGQEAAQVPYLIQRLDEIDIRIVDLVAERATVASEREALVPLVAEVERTLARVDRFEPVAPTDSLVWRASPAASATLTGGEEAMQILDCSHRFIEVTFSERHFGQIQPGTVARVQLRGSDEYFNAPVSALRGVRNEDGDRELSAIERARADPSLTLYLEIPAPDPTQPAIASAFCDVGRSAEVRILRPALTEVLCLLPQVFPQTCSTTAEAPATATARGIDTISDRAPTGG